MIFPTPALFCLLLAVSLAADIKGAGTQDLQSQGQPALGSLSPRNAKPRGPETEPILTASGNGDPAGESTSELKDVKPELANVKGDRNDAPAADEPGPHKEAITRGDDDSESYDEEVAALEDDSDLQEEGQVTVFRVIKTEDGEVPIPVGLGEKLRELHQLRQLHAIFSVNAVFGVDSADSDSDSDRVEPVDSAESF